jgi:hypothetical protein
VIADHLPPANGERNTIDVLESTLLAAGNCPRHAIALCGVHESRREIGHVMPRICDLGPSRIDDLTQGPGRAGLAWISASRSAISVAMALSSEFALSVICTLSLRTQPRISSHARSTASGPSNSRWTGSRMLLSALRREMHLPTGHAAPPPCVCVRWIFADHRPGAAEHSDLHAPPVAHQTDILHYGLPTRGVHESRVSPRSIGVPIDKLWLANLATADQKWLHADAARPARARWCIRRGLQGGGTYGEKLHQAGMLSHEQNVSTISPTDEHCADGRRVGLRGLQSGLEKAAR